MILELLAERLTKVTFDSLPAAAVVTAKAAILDTLGVTLAGSIEECTLAAARTLQTAAAAGPALIFGDTRRVDVLSAAFINGVAAHALDFDDRSSTIGGPLSARNCAGALGAGAGSSWPCLYRGLCGRGRLRNQACTYCERSAR